MDSGDRTASPYPMPNDAPTSRGGRLDKAPVHASDAPLREGNRLTLLKAELNTYDDRLAAISRAK